MKTLTRIATTTLAAVALAISASGCTAASDGSGGKTDSPLMEYLGAVYGTNLSASEQEQRYAESQKKSEELVAQCMKDQGFEYTPNTQNVSFSAGDADMWKPDDRDWVSQYGYGMVKNPMSDQPAQETPYTDPNQGYLDSLSQTEQTAYWEALYGPQPTEDQLGEDGSYEYDWKTAGCQGAAQHETNSDPMQDEQFASLNEAINTFYTDMATNTAFAEINQKWSSCMSDAGHTGFSAQTDAQMSISNKLSSYYEKMSGSSGAQENDPELATLAEEEVAVALADLDCRTKTGYTAEQQKVQFELERQFIADHKAELEALKAAAEQAGR
ncbi:hypothetical protein JVX92_08720 [Microbacterium hominis]|uniref:hypothetical protein n=1 Tax=Microbacterium hominis TaxID=162426 RepID=UPI0019623FAF|nr:hypothetical protein [Microbacterium hominis]QRY39631.1 hypothetical protein JVX92_08720 [Microbacterium hominis]